MKVQKCRQKTTALSSAEAEYSSTTEVACEAVGVRTILNDLRTIQAKGP